MKQRSHPILFILMTILLTTNLGFSQEISKSLLWTDELDTLFQPAINSPDYLVIKKSEWNGIKELFIESIKAQETQFMQREIDRMMVDSTEHVKTSKILPIEKSEAATNNPLLLLLIPLIGYAAFITFKLYAQRERVKLNQDILDQTEKEFQKHKKSSVERERKLMRELIDTKNKLEEINISTQKA